MISLGICTQSFHKAHYFKSHYSHQNQFQVDTIYRVQFRIKEVLKSSSYHHKYYIDILHVNQTPVKGTCLLNIPKDSLFKSLKVDAIYNTKTAFQELPLILNPHQFDYKSYLNKQHIYHQITIEASRLFLIDERVHTIFGYSHELRQQINDALLPFNFQKDELSIMNALLLGQRQDISNTIYKSYTNAGAIHILAVSGLHVGIILLVLNLVLKPLKYLKQGRLLKAFLIIVLLWAYAIIAGLSASVIRAVLMFSMVTIGMHLKRPNSIFNTLFGSLFLLVVVKPSFLYDVGFQLSYLAVFSIVIFQPMIYNLIDIKFKILDYPWKLLSVTLSAQIGILPISLYYFHQFPGLFFISNLVIIPFLGIILSMGLLVIFLALIQQLPLTLAQFYSAIIQQLNQFITWVGQQEAFLFTNISFDISQVIFCYTLIFCFLRLRQRLSYKHIIYTLGSILLFQVYSIFEKHQQVHQQIIVFHKNKHSIIGLQHFKNLIIHSSLEAPENERLLVNYTVGAATTIKCTDAVAALYTLNSKQLLVVDSMGIYNIKSLEPDIILLRHSPKINLVRLIDSLQPQLIIADGSNFKSYQERWRLTCKAKKIPFHQTGKKGAYIIKD